jgi:hypothetical protein
MSHFSFPSIEGLHNVVRTHGVYPQIFPERQSYRGKPKLHGTNAGVRLADAMITAQSRSNDLDAQNDNAGFAKWVESRRDFFARVRYRTTDDLVIFGEWAGPGIMKGTACNQVSAKFFAIFMIVFLDRDNEWADIITEPNEISLFMGDLPEDVHVLPWIGQPLEIVWGDRESLQAAADAANREVEAVEACDPWMKATFGVEGIGEGLVYYPDGVTNVKRFGDFAFKAKGEKHKVTKTKESVQVDPEVASSVDEFVELFVTPARLEQGLDAVGGNADPKLTGKFLAWIGQDVEKESGDELQASGLDWKQVAKPVGNAARKWFIERATTI